MYAYVSFDLVLQEWIDRPPHLTEYERSSFRHIAKLNLLLTECENAARTAESQRILELIPIAKRFLQLWEQSIRYRIQQDKLVSDEDCLGADGF